MAVDDYEKMCSLGNLKRAYRWIQSNPDAQYKSYFRDSYSAYAASSDYNLRRLRKNLIRRAYEPGHAAKIYVPKPSGILRPITILTVNDQIVYQACMNIVAEKLNPKVRARKNKKIFGNLYAGKSSRFFYLKWQDGYKKFANEVKENIDGGLNFVANFDLTAFYDSIDHHVINHFLKELRIENDLAEFLLQCLKTWTCNTWTSVSNYIYHEHGIPQGPLSSGMLSEIILKHLDDVGCRRGSVKYLRYVDDIKLFSKTESSLRQRLISLDIAAKEVGLFPQSSKVNIRKVKNYIEEIKSVSNPPEASVFPFVKKESLVKRLSGMIKRGMVAPENLTRFKYLLGHCEPTSKLNSRLVSLLYKQPFLSAQIATYFSKYKKIPIKASDELLQFITGEEVYHSAHGDILSGVLDNLPDDHRDKCAAFAHRRLLTPPKKLPRPQPTYKASLIAWVVKQNKLTFAEYEDLIKSEVDWWVIKCAIEQLEIDRYGRPSYEKFSNSMLFYKNADIARNAALKIVEEGLTLTDPSKAHEAARLLLFAGGKSRRIGKPDSLVESVLKYVLDAKFAKYDWQKLLGAKNEHAEHIAFTVKKHYESDINACVVTLDSLLDLIFEVLFDRSLPARTYGHFGTMLNNPTMKTTYPTVCTGFSSLHQLRLQSVTAHPRHRGRGTRRLKHHDFYSVRVSVRSSIQEIIDSVSP